jgi:hypothetical protein
MRFEQSTRFGVSLTTNSCQGSSEDFRASMARCRRAEREQQAWGYMVPNGGSGE